MAMKFVLKSSSSCAARHGVIKEIQRLPGVTMETPLFMLHTRGGSIPHITHEVLQMVSEDSLPIQVPLTSVLHSANSVKKFEKGLPAFVGLAKYFMYCTVQDSAEVVPSGFNTSTSISLFTQKGREQLRPDRYMDVIEAFSPDMYQTLCDGDTNRESGKKRSANSVSRTISFSEKCLERHMKSEVLKNKAILGVVEGSYDNSMRTLCAQEMAKKPFAGFVLDGFHNGGSNVENILFEDMQNVLKETLACLPDDKFRVAHGSYNPKVILDLINIGIDIFDGSYPYIVTERGSALTFTYEAPSLDKGIGDVSEGSLDMKKNYEINLKDERYFGDFEPINKSCSCLTCREHTRSYIHHLLTTNELLGRVLLMIHNTHHYLEFFKAIRTALKNNLWKDYYKWFCEMQ